MCSMQTQHKLVWATEGGLHYSGVHGGPHMFMLCLHTTEPSSRRYSSTAILYAGLMK